MNTIQSVSQAMSSEDIIIEDRGYLLEKALSKVAEGLGEAGTITNNRADVEFLLNIVTSYIITKRDNPEFVIEKRPSELFEENLFGMLDNQEEEYDGDRAAIEETP